MLLDGDVVVHEYDFIVEEEKEWLHYYQGQFGVEFPLDKTDSILNRLNVLKWCSTTVHLNELKYQLSVLVYLTM